MRHTEHVAKQKQLKRTVKKVWIRREQEKANDEDNQRREKNWQKDKVSERK